MRREKKELIFSEKILIFLIKRIIMKHEHFRNAIAFFVTLSVCSLQSYIQIYRLK